MAQRLGFCHLSLVGAIDRPQVASRWTAFPYELQVSVAVAGREGHDIAMEVLLCLGQALWERLDHSQHKTYWLLLDGEIRAQIAGEIDEQALRQKKALLAGRFSAASGRRLERYGIASFAATAAEYVHSLWHDVTVRGGPDYLPSPCLRRRMQLLARWFPPDRGYRLFPRRRRERA
jgi:hypothetical protein